MSIDRVLKEYSINIDASTLMHTHKLLSEIIQFPDKTSREFYQEFNYQYLIALGVNPKDEILNDIFKACSYLSWEAFSDVHHLNEIGLPMGIISNWDETIYAKLGEHINVKFDNIIGSKEFGTAKPSLRIYEHAIDKSGVNAEEILYIGDSIRLDYIPAKKLGIKALIVDRTPGSANTNVNRISSLEELTNYI